MDSCLRIQTLLVCVSRTRLPLLVHPTKQCVIWVQKSMKQKKNLPLPTSIAKQRVQSAGIPIIPGYSGEDQSIETLVQEGKKIGY